MPFKDAETARAWRAAYQQRPEVQERRQEMHRRQNKARRMLDIGWLHDSEEREPRPPAEVILEKEFRMMLPLPTEGPPAPYRGMYYVKAWRVQRQFART